MQQYRDALDAAHSRIRTLEAQLQEAQALVDGRDASLRARQIESEELEKKLRAVQPAAGSARRGVTGWWLPLGVTVAAALAIGGLSLALAQPRPLAQTAPVAFTMPVAVTPPVRSPDVARLQAKVAELDESVAQLHDRPRAEPTGQGTLVAIAIGGSCDFYVDGVHHGRKSSLRLKVAHGAHVVRCDSDDEVRSQSVAVHEREPGIASFKVASGVRTGSIFAPR